MISVIAYINGEPVNPLQVKHRIAIHPSHIVSVLPGPCNSARVFMADGSPIWVSEILDINEQITDSIKTAMGVF